MRPLHDLEWGKLLDLPASTCILVQLLRVNRSLLQAKMTQIGHSKVDISDTGDASDVVDAGVRHG